MATKDKGKRSASASTSKAPGGQKGPAGGKASSKSMKDAERNPEGRPLSGRDPRFHSPDSLKKPPPPPRSFRWVVVAIPAGMAFLVAAHVGLWFFAANKARQGVEAWADARRAEGYTVSLGEVSVGGFPLRVRAEIPTPAVTAPAALGGWSWSAPGLLADVNPFTPSSFTLIGSGHHAFRLPFGPQGSVVPVGVSADAFTARLSVDGAGGIDEAKIQGTGLAVEGLPQGPMRIGRLDLHTLNGPLYGDAPRNAVSWSMSFHAAGITPPPGGRLGLGAKIERISVDARAFGARPPGPWHEALPQWRDNKGAVRIDGMAVDWEPLSLRASGSFTVDKDLQPDGGVSAQVTGLFPLIEGLAAQGLVRDADAAVARMVLSGLSRGSGTFNIPINVRNRRLYAGSAPLMPLPTLNWGGKGPRDLNRVAPGFEVGREGDVQRRGAAEDDVQ